MILPGVLPHLQKYMNKPKGKYTQYVKSLLLAKLINADQFKNMISLGKLLLLDKQPQLLDRTPITHPQPNLYKFLLNHLDFISALLSFDDNGEAVWSPLVKWAGSTGVDPATLIWFYNPYFFSGNYIPPSGFSEPLTAISQGVFKEVKTIFYRLPVSGLITYEIPPILTSFDYLAIYYFIVGPCVKANGSDILFHLERLLDYKVSLRRLAKKCSVKSDILQLAFNVLGRNLYIVKFLKGLGIQGFVGQWIEMADVPLDTPHHIFSIQSGDGITKPLVECLKSQRDNKVYCRLHILTLIELLRAVRNYRRVGRLFRNSLQLLLESVDNYLDWMV